MRNTYLSKKREHRMRCIPNQDDLPASADPGGQWRKVGQLPLQAARYLCQNLAHDGVKTRIMGFHLVQVSWLIPPAYRGFARMTKDHVVHGPLSDGIRHDMAVRPDPAVRIDVRHEVLDLGIGVHQARRHSGAVGAMG